MERSLLGDCKLSRTDGEPMERAAKEPWEARGEHGAASLLSGVGAFKFATIFGQRRATFRHQSFDELVLAFSVSSMRRGEAYDSAGMAVDNERAGVGDVVIPD